MTWKTKRLLIVPALQEVQSAFLSQATHDYWEGMGRIAAAVEKLTSHEP